MHKIILLFPADFI